MYLGICRVVPGRLNRLRVGVTLAQVALALLTIIILSPNVHAAITFVQGTSNIADSGGTISATYASAQNAGDFNVVVVDWADSTSTVNSVTDSEGNTYVAVVGPTRSTGNDSQQMFYAKNISSAAANANTVTVAYSTTVDSPEIRMVEYSGVSTTNPLDVDIGTSGTGLTMNSGSITTTNANDLLVAANAVYSNTTYAGDGYTERVYSGFEEIIEDETVSAVGSYSATATQGSSGYWLMQLAAFRAASTPPTAPTNVTTTVLSSTGVNLSWTASSDPAGVTGYIIQRCSGASCTNFAQIGTATTTSYSDSGLSAETSYSYQIQATDAAGNLSSFSSTATVSTDGLPTTPTNLVATAISGTQVNLTWTASTASQGVSGYVIQRCSGASCTSFAQVGTSTTTSYSDTGLTASTSYSYQVEATDSAGDLSAFSSTATAVTSAGGSGGSTIGYVQGTSNTADSGTSISTTYYSAQGAGDLNVVVVDWADSTSTVGSLTDSQGNTYVAVVGPTRSSGNDSQQMFYAKNIASASAGANTVTVTYSTTVAYPEIRIVEYSGISTSNPLDVDIGASGTGLTMSSGSITTTNANDLLVAANAIYSETAAPGTGYTQRVESAFTEIIEDETVSATGSYSATATQTSSGYWLMQLAAFRAASGSGSSPAAPTNLTDTVVSGSQITLSWTASSGATSYVIQRCQGAGCTNFAQIGTSTTASYSDTGLTASTSYSYRVDATNASGTSGFSSTATGSTGAAPTVPSNVAATVISSTQINVSWTASTDSGGISDYIIQRCEGVGCTNFVQVGTSTTTTYTDTGVSAGAVYSYRLEATDSGGDLSGFSATTSADTPNTYTYDTYGHLYSVTTSGGIVYYHYDAAGHLISVSSTP